MFPTWIGIDRIPYVQTIRACQRYFEKTREALQRSDKPSARYLAQITAAKVPNMEDPWLILPFKLAFADYRRKFRFLIPYII